MPHVILLGDSIFDNASYVPGGPSVIEHVRRILPAGWQASLLARDGATTEEVPAQLQQLPADTSHLVISAGGNDALEMAGPMLHESARSFESALKLAQEMREEFRDRYRKMLQSIAVAGRPSVVCTVYDSVPGLSDGERAGLALFNEVILFEAFRARISIIDLRLVCNESADYAPISPIEPSVYGGGKIARALIRAVTQIDQVGGDIRVF